MNLQVDIFLKSRFHCNVCKQWSKECFSPSSLWLCEYSINLLDTYVDTFSQIKQSGVVWEKSFSHLQTEMFLKGNEEFLDILEYNIIKLFPIHKKYKIL